MKNAAGSWLVAWGALVVTTLFGLGSCKALLGGFDLVEGDGGGGASEGGSGATGGAGGNAAGGAGGQGGAVELPPYLDCSWVDPIVEVDSLEGEIDTAWDKRLHAERVNDGVRVFAVRPGTADVFTIDDKVATSWSFPVDRMNQLLRLDGLHMAALITSTVDSGAGGAGPGDGNLQLAVRIFDDDDPDGSASTETVISDPLAFEDANSNTFDARFFPQDDGAGALGTARFAATYRTANELYRGVLGVFDGATPATPIRFTQYVDADAHPQLLLHDAGDNYFYMGEFEQQLYVFGDSPSPADPDRELTADTGIFGSLGLNADGTVNAQLFTVAGSTFSTYVGQVEVSALDSVTTDDLVALLSLDFSEIIVDGGGGWYDETLIATGHRSTTPEELSLLIAHELGVLQTDQELPYPSVSVVPAGGTIIGAIAVPQYEGLSWVGGIVHLAWIVELEPVPGSPFHVLYYGEVHCDTWTR